MAKIKVFRVASAGTVSETSDELDGTGWEVIDGVLTVYSEDAVGITNVAAYPAGSWERVRRL